MKIIVDTNIVFSALLNSNSHIGQLLLDSRNYFQFYSCKYLKKELFRHLPKIHACTNSLIIFPQKSTKNNLQIHEKRPVFNIFFINSDFIGK